MVDKIINTIRGYVLQNNADVLSTEEKAEIEAEITYLEKLRDYGYLEQRINKLQDALIEVVTPLPQKDVQIPRKDFIEIYNKCVGRMFEEYDKGISNGSYEKKMLGCDTTIHWNGMYCNCGSGAIISSEIIPGIEGVEEDEEEYL